MFYSVERLQSEEQMRKALVKKINLVFLFPMVYTEGFLEVAIESWPESDLNPQPLNSVQMLQPTDGAVRS